MLEDTSSGVLCGAEDALNFRFYNLGHVWHLEASFTTHLVSCVRDFKDVIFELRIERALGLSPLLGAGLQ